MYLHGLLGPDGRRSPQPLAARLGRGGHDQLQHFTASPAWNDAPLRRVLVEKADALVGGPGAVLAVDDTALPKKGRHSVGVARQYRGCPGERANCRALVSLTLARGEGPVPIGLRLFLPAEWTDEPDRCARAGVPGEHRRALAKTEIALAEIDRTVAAGARFGRVLAAAGHGSSAAFRRGLSERGLTRAVGILKGQNVYPPTVELRWPTAAAGRPRKQPVPGEAPSAAEAALADAGWRPVSWRRGTKGPLGAEFAALRVRPPCAGAPGRGGPTPQRPAPAGGRGLARGRAPRDRRAEALPREPARRRAAREACGDDQGALGLRAGAPAAGGGTRPRPLRGPVLDGPASARADDADRLRLPPAPAARSGPAGGGESSSTETPGPPPQPTLPAVRRMPLERLWRTLTRCPSCGARLGPSPPVKVPR